MNHLKRIVSVVFLSGLLAVSLASPAPAQRGTAPLLARPDLQVEKIEFSTAPNPGGGTRLTIFYTLYNDSNIPSRNTPTAAGKAGWKATPAANLLFMSSIEYRDYSNGTYQPLSDLGLELGPHERQKCNALLLVPALGRRQFRVRVDSKNWIDESNEINNEKTAIWPPLGVVLPKQK